MAQFFSYGRLAFPERLDYKFVNWCMWFKGMYILRMAGAVLEPSSAREH